MILINTSMLIQPLIMVIQR